MGRVLDQILAAYKGKHPSWLNDPKIYVENLAKNAPDKFDGAFERWRDLYSSAYEQLKAANKGSETHGLSAIAREKFSNLHKRATSQLKILEDGRSTYSSDFYSYRYLATEGFLPGYNFPRLPLYAYVPGDGHGGTFLSRARFFGISEFGPGNLIYHEGRAYRVVKAKLPLAEDVSASNDLVGNNIYLCSRCGASHDKEVEFCHVCSRNLVDNDLVKNTLRINSVEAVSAERITANDEERVRRGYEIQTVFSWPEHSSGQYQVEEADFYSNGKLLFSLQYANGAEISRINKGLKRRKDKKVYGFNIDPDSGWWASSEEEKQPELPPPTKRDPVRIVPIVQERKNALLLKFNEPNSISIEAKATIQHALIRGIEVTYQLEQGEVLGEPLPNRENRRTILIYEATEGGAGVLKRLVEDKSALSRVAVAVLNLVHFESVKEKINQFVTGQEIKASTIGLKSKEDSCVHGCYRCLLSYYNQLDHEIIERNRDEVVEFLFALATGKLRSKSPETPLVGVSSKDSKWLDSFANLNLPTPDTPNVEILGNQFDFTWSSYYIAATTGLVTVETKQKIESQGWWIIELPENPEDGVPEDLIKELKGEQE